MSVGTSRTCTMTLVSLAVFLSLALGGCPGPAGTEGSRALPPPQSKIVPGTYVGTQDCETFSAALGGTVSSAWALSVQWDGAELAIDGKSANEGAMLEFEIGGSRMTMVVSNVAVSSTSIQIDTEDTMRVEALGETAEYTGFTKILLTYVDDSTLRYEDSTVLSASLPTGAVDVIAEECGATLRR